MLKHTILLASAAGLVLALAPADGAMDFVTIGNAGNPADTRYVGEGETGYGGVNYEYSIGKYEVSIAQWTPSGVGGNEDYWNTEDGGYLGEDAPAAKVDYWDAAQFANWMTTGDPTDGYYIIDKDGKSSIPDDYSGPHAHYFYALDNGPTYFIPTEDEWYKAAYYDASTETYYNYQTGSDSKPTGVPEGTAPGTAVYDGGEGDQEDPAVVDNAGGLSPYGTMAQGGNLREWCEGWKPSEPTRKIVRGGRYNHDWRGLHASFQSGVFPQYGYSNSGLRLTQVVPEPATLALLGLGGVGLLTRRRRGRGRV